MSDVEAQIKAEIRLAVLEYLVTKLYVGHFQYHRIPTEDVRRMAVEHAGYEQIIPGLTPEQSDHASAEWREAIEKMLNMQLEMLAKARGEPMPEPVHRG